MASSRSLLCCLFLLFAVFQLDAFSADPAPIVIAHRGASGHRPEHTLAAYELAINMGADYVEVDVCSTSDHELVAIHDANLKMSTNVADHPEFASRRTNRTLQHGPEEGWFIDDFTLAEIRTLRVVQRFSYRPQGFNGVYQLPTLKEAIQLLLAKEAETGQSIGLYIETKEPTHFRENNLPLEGPLIEILTAYDMIDRDNLLIESFDPSALINLREMAPSLKLVRLVEVDLSDDDLTEIARYANGIGASKALIAPPKGTPLHGVVDPTNLVQRAHQLKLLIHVWTFRDDPFYIGKSAFNSSHEEYMHFFHLGIDGFFTDFPDTAIQERDKFIAIRTRVLTPIALYMLLLPVALVGLLGLAWLTGKFPFKKIVEDSSY